MNKFYLYSLNKEANCGMKLDEVLLPSFFIFYFFFIPLFKNKKEMIKYQKSELKSSKLEDFYKAFVLTA